MQSLCGVVEVFCTPDAATRKCRLQNEMQPTHITPLRSGFKNTAPSGGGGSRRGCLIPDRPTEQLHREREAQQQEAWRQILNKTEARRREIEQPKPLDYEAPAYNTPEYWRDCSKGWISDEEQCQHHADYETRRRRALDSKHNRAKPPHRHQRAAPLSTKQFSKPMSTQAARDDRLTPQSKALLQVLVARTGRGRSTDTTKTTLAKIMNRCPRSIQRYLQELVKFGYIRTQARKSRRTGFYIGLRVWLMNSVLPFFKQEDDNYEPAKWLDLVTSRRKPEETALSPTNCKDSYLGLLCEKKPPWFAEFAFQ